MNTIVDHYVDDHIMTMPLHDTLDRKDMSDGLKAFMIQKMFALLLTLIDFGMDSVIEANDLAEKGINVTAR
jgi:hypothetical protein